MVTALLGGAWRTLVANAAGMAAGLVADRLVGEPPARMHPVALFGSGAGVLERWMWADRRAAGAAFTAVAVGSVAAIGVGMRAVTARWGARVGATAPTALVPTACAPTALAPTALAPTAVVAVATWAVVAGRMLGESAATVGDAVRAGDLERARELLPSLVGRDPRDLDAGGICRAVVESVAENTVDAVVAPALWALVGGAPGALAYRAINTLDAMVGHHRPRYERFGWASARADDLAVWVPARLTALLVAAVRPAAAAAVWATVRRDAPGHPSPNAGVAEAAFAAALGVRLGGTNRYGERIEQRPFLGGGRRPGPDDIVRAVRLSRDLTAALAGTGALLGGAGCRRRSLLGG